MMAHLTVKKLPEAAETSHDRRLTGCAIVPATLKRAATFHVVVVGDEPRDCQIAQKTPANAGIVA
jgi:hypothetical protein